MEETTVELIIHSNDEKVIGEIEKHFADSEVTRGRKARALDAVVAIAVVTGVLKLINELLTLREKLLKMDNPPDIIVKTLSGNGLSLKDATDDELKSLVK